MFIHVPFPQVILCGMDSCHKPIKSKLKCDETGKRKTKFYLLQKRKSFFRSKKTEVMGIDFRVLNIFLTKTLPSSIFF